MQPRRIFDVIFCLFMVSFPGFTAGAEPVTPQYAADRKLLATASTTFDWQDEKRNRRIPVKIYHPKDVPGPFPVILFSHGLGGTRETYRYLGEQWAANGYVCVHVQHIGSDDSAWRGQQRPMESLRKAANLDNSIARPLDVSFVIDQLAKLNQSDETFKGRLNLDQIGCAGHSFGGQTAFLIGGQQLGGAALGQLASRIIPKLEDPRVKAILPMSPAVPEAQAVLDHAYSKITLPTFVMTGTEDDSPIGATQAEDRRKPFDHLPKGTIGYLLIFEGGDHMVFSGRPRAVAKPTDARFQELIRLSSTAFWDAYLKNDETARQWLRDGAFGQLLGKDGTFEKQE